MKLEQDQLKTLLDTPHLKVNIEEETDFKGEYKHTELTGWIGERYSGRIEIQLRVNEEDEEYRDIGTIEVSGIKYPIDNPQEVLAFFRESYTPPELTVQSLTKAIQAVAPTPQCKADKIRKDMEEGAEVLRIIAESDMAESLGEVFGRAAIKFVEIVEKVVKDVKKPNHLKEVA